MNFWCYPVTAYTFERIDRNDSALLIIDHQVGLIGIVRDSSTEDMYNNIILHASLGETYNLPVVITTSTDQGTFVSRQLLMERLPYDKSSCGEGPNGPLLPEISDMYPDVTIVRRGGEINAWDNADFRAAVKATGKKQVIVGGITTDVSRFSCKSYGYVIFNPKIVTQVCTMFVSLSLLEAGYTVFANADASGTFDARAADLANARMRDAGVYVIPQFAVAADLQRDWRNPPGIPVFLDLLFKYVCFYVEAKTFGIISGMT